MPNGDKQILSHHVLVANASAYIEQEFSCNLSTSFVSTALASLKIDTDVLICALIYLKRMKSNYPKVRSLDAERLLFVALLISYKYLTDDSVYNIDWPFFTESQQVSMETHFLHLIKYNLHIDTVTFKSFKSFISMQHR